MRFNKDPTAPSVIWTWFDRTMFLSLASGFYLRYSANTNVVVGATRNRLVFDSLSIFKEKLFKISS